MSDDSTIRIDDGLSIPKGEISYHATRSGGPGGQHVNTSSTRVELTWDIGASAALTEAQRARLLEKLARRIDGAGVLHLTSSVSRSQHQNREDVTARFQRLVAEALKERKRRKRTRPTKASKEARLREKRKRSDVKRDRGPIRPED